MMYSGSGSNSRKYLYNSVLKKFYRLAIMSRYSVGSKKSLHSLLWNRNVAIPVSAPDNIYLAQLKQKLYRLASCPGALLVASYSVVEP
jgi:hypothetical protein